MCISAGMSPGQIICPNQRQSVILRDVRALSNFLQRGDGWEPSGKADYRPARIDETQRALALILGTSEEPAAEAQVLEFLQFAHQRSIDVHDLWVIAIGNRLVWAMLPIISPGHTALLLMPPARPDSASVRPLIESVCEYVETRGVTLAQVMLDPADAPGRSIFVNHGFREMAHLIYLQTAVPGHIAAVSPPESFWWQTYSEQTHAGFEQTILESYQQSLDCPALNGMRNISDVIKGHQAAGEFNPRFWFLLSERDVPRAVLLLSRVPRTDSAELVYLGLTPAARRRGISDLLMRQALWATHEMGLNRLTLAVDSNNVPALRLYHRHGMQQIGVKLAMMRELKRDDIAGE